MNAPDDQKALVFAAVFVIVWLGSAIVTVNALLLGGNLYVRSSVPLPLINQFAGHFSTVFVCLGIVFSQLMSLLFYAHCGEMQYLR